VRWPVAARAISPPHSFVVVDRIGNVVDAGIAKRQTASVYLNWLVRAGVLEEVSAGRESSSLTGR
jgi:hypothetical protein